jgi:DnaJ-class molecular chaperone
MFLPWSTLLCFLLLAAFACCERDFYAILGVKKGADIKVIKKSYKKLSLKWHPDKNSAPEAEEKFQEIAEAYTILSDEEKRKIYDQYGEEGLKEHEKRGGQPANPFDIFDMFGFGGGRRGHNEPHTESIEVPLRVSLRQLYVGESVEVSFTRQVLCIQHNSCQKDCPDCQGPGI